MIRRFALPIVLLALVSCGPNPTGPIATSNTLVRLSADRLNFVSLGDTVSVTASFQDVGGQEVTGPIFTWISSDALIATVSGTGLVTAVANGSATVTAMIGALSASASVSVTQAAFSLTLSADSLNFVSLGDTASVTGLILDAGGQEATGATITWSSSDALIATVSGAGLVTAVANGSATVTAMSGSASATTRVTVTQAAVNRVLSDSVLTFATLTDTTQLTAAVTDARGSTINGLRRTAR
jgi:trimeric autotransporter adhesin